MKFVFKINSAYDGFTPARIPERFKRGTLILGWSRYLDDVERGQEVWVYFLGPHRFVPGVYAMGTVSKIDRSAGRVALLVREYDTAHPLTATATGLLLRQIVDRRYRQVFVLPEELAPTPACTVTSTAESCKAHHCASCTNWNALPRIEQNDCLAPAELAEAGVDHAAAYWVIPSRCFIPKSELRPGVRQTSELFMRFKTGEAALAYPLALGLRETLEQRDLLEVDCIVPIPLSPDKRAAKEIPRALLLARELARLLGVDVVEALELKEALSKRRFMEFVSRDRGLFQSVYARTLEVKSVAQRYDTILLVDDVSTYGSTLAAAGRRIREVNPNCTVVTATAGQMILKSVVVDEDRLTGA